ncbi:unnamed protein product [Rhizophagus irregularis]|uniref:ATPase AAA-type core domain-containing protein n=1 Tax=Rhizophagus irregularis TaxID=588596 RepID=A0A916DXE6_9GLOM|nr:unnamed protein product [Rhizophagus irregularis]CAB5290603.1 unnamed protein product [Rhizophagus irregularis]
MIANKYQETTSKQFPVISVVLLDEVGLAETSPFNPLKVLHSLLEPSYPATGPTVSVIGISNWRLDNSKSSRALLVQRPQFDLDDLVDTAERLLNTEFIGPGQRGALEPLAKAYSDYEKEGSQFPDDREDYSYSVLRRIMMCVEEGRPLILTDLEIIYGSLYDLWNQNYIVVGSKENVKYFTRVALGAYANPMLYVSPQFKYETLQSLVIDVTKNNSDASDEDILNECKECLIATASSDGMTEAQLSNRVKHFWLESTDKMLILQCDVTTVNAGFNQAYKVIKRKNIGVSKLY